jgi:5-bromo-4-chloroindolyl phosphate hydrolysis protein
MQWDVIGTLLGITVFLYTATRNFRIDMHEQLDVIRNDMGSIRKDLKEETGSIRKDLKEDMGLIRNDISSIRNDLKEFRAEVHLEHAVIRSDIVDVKERLAFLEGISVYTLEPIHSNPRSEAAKEMWKRRKQKGLEQKSS